MYTSIERLKSFTQGELGLSIMYGHHHQRINQRYLNHYHVTLKLWAGACEYITKGTQTTTLTYLSGPGGLYALHLINPDESESLRYLHTDHLGSWTAVSDETGEVVDEQSYDACSVKLDFWEGSEPKGLVELIPAEARGREGNRRNDSTWTNVGELQPPLFDRGFTGHEHLDGFQLINMNGRMYDPVTSRMLAPDNFVQTPDFSQNFNRYSYCFNNPLIYTDPDGEIAWFVPIIIGAAIFGTGNLTAHAIRGDVNSFGDGLKYFGQGALAGAALGAAWQFAPLIPGIGQAAQTGMNVYGAVHLGGTAVSAVSGLGQGVFTGDWSVLGNSGEIFLGNFYLDENRSFFGGVWQGISRHTWEFPQTGLGHTWTQLRNTFGGVDRVDYFGGATFATRENQDGRSGMSLGNFINISIWDEIEGNFDERVITDPLFMHEYGHSFDSQIFGISYLLTIGLPSLISAGTSSQVDGEPFGVTTHDFRWYEMRANRHAARYFNRHFGVNWDPFEIMNPRRRR